MGSILDNNNQIMTTVDVVMKQEVKRTSSKSNCNRMLTVPSAEEVVPNYRDNFCGSEGPNLIFAQGWLNGWGRNADLPMQTSYVPQTYHPAPWT